MRNYIICLFSFLCLCACNQPSPVPAVTFEAFTIDKTVPIADEQGAPRCNVHLEMQEAAKPCGDISTAINRAIAKSMFNSDLPSLREAADSFANAYTQGYIRDFAPLYREDKSFSERHAWYDYHYNIIVETKQQKEGIISYLASIDYYEGGAHGIHQQLVLNFNAADGKAFTLDDLFVTGYENQLNDILLDELCLLTDSKSLDELHGKGYLYEMAIFPSSNFMIDEERITFIYNPYEIAPYAVGIIELNVSYERLKNILKK